ncbi:toxin [Flavisolibacter sp. BT320]|nr:toxin [Flavisolibacter longurius]
MEKRNEVQSFLNDFKTKLKIWGVIFRDNRSKNSQSVLDLEITTELRTQILSELQLEDFCEGPIDDTLYGVASMWVFGKLVKKKEIYIKISMGRPGSQTICISFHVAERKMKYFFK